MSQTNLEGQIIGNYRVLEALGRGGMARVYRAYHPQLERYVAIKVLRNDLIEEQDLLERFQREARMVASLRHPNIVQVFDFNIQDDIYYMVMELLEGDSLRARLNNYRSQGERMPLPEVLAISNDVLNALGYAHSQGMIHRDIKPANIMLNAQGAAVVTDFGVAQIAGSTRMTVTGALMGTLSYMAPEQGMQGQCDQRSDLYSMGIMLFEMLTGYTPFDADTPLAILMKHLHDPLPLPRRIDPELPAVLETILLKALAKDPNQRYQSAQEMSAVLRQIEPQDLPKGTRRLASSAPEIDTHAVFSGTARQQIKDQHFAELDTDPDLARSLNPALPPVETKTTGPLHSLFLRPVNTAGTILSGLGAILFINFLTSMLSTLTGINIYSRGWAFELFLASGFLAVIMWAVETHWLLIPILIIMGNALLLAYTALSGRWNDWIFLWMLEALIIGAAIAIPIRIQRLPNLKFLTRSLSALILLICVILTGLICLLALLIGLLQKIT